MNTEKKTTWALLWIYNDEIIQWLGAGTIEECCGAMYMFFNELYSTSNDSNLGNIYLGLPEWNGSDGRWIVTVYNKETGKNEGHFHFVEWEGEREIRIEFGNKRNPENT